MWQPGVQQLSFAHWLKCYLTLFMPSILREVFPICAHFSFSWVGSTLKYYNAVIKLRIAFLNSFLSGYYFLEFHCVLEADAIKCLILFPVKMYKYLFCLVIIFIYFCLWIVPDSFKGASYALKFMLHVRDPGAPTSTEEPVRMVDMCSCPVSSVWWPRKVGASFLGLVLLGLLLF